MLWQDFLDCARRNAKGATEADWRTAVSRTYYAIFHSFREWLGGRGLDIGTGASAHSNLYFGLSNCGVPAMHSIANQIDRLRTDRTRADYDLRRLFRQHHAVSAIVAADAIDASFQTLIRITPPQQIADGAKNYLKSIGRIP